MLVKRLRQVTAGIALYAMLVSALVLPVSATFQDVPAGHWAEKEIRRCVELGYFNGVTAEHFGLGQPMTRSAAVVVLCRFFGWETPTPQNLTYRDVPVNAWYAGAVQAAYNHGALTAQWEEFRPADPITREELAVMLVRALGYSAIAGLSSEENIPFEDVTTNAGYIATAYQLGLVGGTTATTFSGEKTATREQVAVILMRLHDKLHRAKPVEKIGILDPAADPGDLTGYTAVAVPEMRLAAAGSAAVNRTLEENDAQIMRAAVLDSGAKALLHVVGSSASLNAKAEDLADVLKDAVETGGYDGILLDIPKLKNRKAEVFTQLVGALKDRLGDKLVYVVAEAPARQGETYEGYDYAALSHKADVLVLRVAPYEKVSGGVVTAPLEPLEEIYYALQTMNGADMSRVALHLTSKSSLWTSGRKTETLSGAELDAMLTEGTLETHYSQRYGCAYVTGIDDADKSIAWYLDKRAVAERMRMSGFFGVNRICLTDANTSAADLLSGLQ